MKQLIVVVVVLGSVAVFAYKSQAAGVEVGVAVPGEPVRIDVPTLGETESSPSANVDLKRPLKEILIGKTVMNSKVCPELVFGPRNEWNSVAVDTGGTLLLARQVQGHPTGGETKIIKCTADGDVWSSPSFPFDKNGWAPFQIPSLDVDQDANVYYAGFYQGKEMTTLVGKVGADGKPIWQANLVELLHTSPGSVFVQQIVASRSGAYVFGRSETQLPRQPADARGMNFVVGLDAKGKSTWLKQSKDLTGHKNYILTSIAANPAGGFLAATMVSSRHYSLSKFGAQGAKEWSHQFESQLQGIAADNGGAVYAVSRVMQAGGSYYITKLSSKGDEIWKREIPAGAKKTIDPVEGVIHSGILGPTHYHTGRRFFWLSVSAGTLYVGGSYTNRYQHGSTPRANHVDAATLAFDSSNGKLKWGHQYRVGPVESPQANVNFYPYAFGQLANGNILVVGGSPGQQRADYEMVAFLLKPNGQPAK